jgi:outer membrane protein TolC
MTYQVQQEMKPKTALKKKPKHNLITAKGLISCQLMSGLIAGVFMPDAGAVSGELPDQTLHVLKATTTLKTKIPSTSEKHPPRYFIETERSQSPKQIGSDAIAPVEILPQNPTLIGRVSSINDEAFVPVNRPPLQALISVQDNLSPYSMDASCLERIGLADALRCAIAHNLSIENDFDGWRSQKYAYLSSLSGFLPDINTGYNLVGLHGSLPGALFGIGSTSTASSGSSSTLQLPSYAQVLQAGFTYHAYQGGKILFSSLQQKHRLRASQASLKGSVNDVLLDAAKRYYSLVLNEALLDIRMRAVEISTEQVRLNTVQETEGTATGLDVLQSQAQLASDQQNLVDQQSTRRQSAIQLATVLNSSFAQDLSSKESYLRKKRVVPPTVMIGELLRIAIDNRPELKQYEELRLAAKKAIVVAGAPLQPKMNLAGSVYGLGAGSTNLSSIFVLNFSINWMLGGLGATDLANVQQARWQARQSAVQAKQTFQDVFQQVRTAYDQSLAADNRIEHASAQINAAEEELRIAKKRMEAGIGLNLDVLNAQRDLTQAGINKAQAIVDFNVAQAQLLHDIGLISSETLTTGARI